MRPFLTLHHPANAARFYRDGYWRTETLYSLLRKQATARPDAVAFQDSRHALTWSDALRWVDGVGAEWRTRGLVPGDCVSIWMSNKVEAIVAFLACSREGYVCNPSLHRTHSSAEVAGLLGRVSARVLVTESGWGSDAGAGPEPSALTSGGRLVYHLDDFPGPGLNSAPTSTDPDRVAYLAFTSGTTGEPKCVMHSENTLLANARELVHAWGHGPDTAFLVLSPLSHHFAWGFVVQALVSGARFIADDRPVSTSRLQWILDTGATFLVGVPTHAIDVLAEQRRCGVSVLGRVQVFCMGGASIPPSVADAFLRQGVRPLNVYGMTENSSHQYTLPSDDDDTIVSTCGRPTRGYEIRLFDPEDANRFVPDGELGEIGGRGPSLMLGYFANQEATERSFNREGFFLSGDLGRIDKKGNLRIEGRIKDMIIRGGVNIQPAHIEGCALRHPQVTGAACFPVADARLGERIGLAVLGDVEPAVLIAHMKAEGLSRYELPEYFVRMAALPLTASGKVLKRTLIEMVKSGAVTPIRIEE